MIKEEWQPYLNRIEAHLEDKYYDRPIYSIQVHFENCAHLDWKEQIDDIETWLSSIKSTDTHVSRDVDNNRIVCFSFKTVTGIIIDKIMRENHVHS